MANDGKYYAVMRDHWGSGMSIVYDDIVKAYQKVLNDLYYYPEGFIRVIDNGVCVMDIEQKDFDLVYSCAAKIINAEYWSDVIDECSIICLMAGMEEEWNAADGDSFLDVIRRAGLKFGIELV